MSRAPVLTPQASLVRLFDIPFTDEQLAAITAPHGPAVVIAGAGSGKTALMSARVVWLVATRERHARRRSSGSRSPTRRPAS